MDAPNGTPGRLFGSRHQPAAADLDFPADGFRFERAGVEPRRYSEPAGEVFWHTPRVRAQVTSAVFKGRRDLDAAGLVAHLDPRLDSGAIARRPVVDFPRASKDLQRDLQGLRIRFG